MDEPAGARKEAIVGITDEEFAGGQQGGQGVNWYVSRRVEVPASDLPGLALPAEVTGAGGATLRILHPVFVDDEHYRSFAGVLSFPGVLPGKVRVELDLNPYSSSLGEIGLRPARHAPRLLVGPDRWFDGAWSVLDALAEAISAPRDLEGAREGAGAAA